MCGVKFTGIFKFDKNLTSYEKVFAMVIKVEKYLKKDE